MERQFKRSVLGTSLILGLPLICGQAYAAKLVDLSHQNVSSLQSFIPSQISTPKGSTAKGVINVEEVSRSVDFNQTLHVRVKETYSGYPVWGGDGIVHIPHGASTAKSLTNVIGAAKNSNGFMNGTLYQDINPDLVSAPEYVFSQSQAQKAQQQAISDYQHKLSGKSEIKDQKSSLIVFIDKDNKAHWAYLVSFYATPPKMGEMPAKPVYIMDAVSFKVYEQWNDIKTAQQLSIDDTLGGGFGGNERMGKLVYDGLKGNLPKLNIKRDAASNSCYWQNADVTVKNHDTGQVMSFPCDATNPDHDNIYWIGDKDAVNGGYSPADDALFGGVVIKNMYQDWYKVPVLTESGKPMMLNMVVHDHIDNAYWDGHQMTFGDGVSMFYPLTSLGVAAHEISHGFTQQHSGLVYYAQSGGMNEAFSDMAAQAVEFYAYGHNSWQIAPEIFKEPDEALRYMDMPSKDCHGRKPGNWCSIDNMSQYDTGLDVHHSSGIYNRVFYLIGSFWTPKKAFDVMVHANMYYWTPNSTFAQGACGVIKAAKDYRYDLNTVIGAFETVGIDVNQCFHVPPTKI